MCAWEAKLQFMGGATDHIKVIVIKVGSNASSVVRRGILLVSALMLPKEIE